MKLIMQDKEGVEIGSFPLRHDTVIHKLHEYIFKYKDVWYTHFMIGDGVFIFRPATPVYLAEDDLGRERKL